MTREEQTISNLKKLKSFHNGSYGTDIDMAIKALEKEPCEDAISRQAVINLTKGCNNALVEPRIFDSHNSGTIFKHYITELPPVNPQSKTDVLDKVRAEIDKIYEREGHSFDCLNALDDLKEFIDKYKDKGERNEIRSRSNEDV